MYRYLQWATETIYFELKSATAPPSVTLICYRPGSKAKLPRIITTGPVHYIFFLGTMAAARPIHTSYSHGSHQAEHGVSSVVAAEGQTAGYVNMCIYQSAY